MAAVAVFDAGHGRLVRSASTLTRPACVVPLLRRVSKDRFLDLTVAEDPDLVWPSPASGAATSGVINRTELPSK